MKGGHNSVLGQQKYRVIVTLTSERDELIVGMKEGKQVCMKTEFPYTVITPKSRSKFQAIIRTIEYFMAGIRTIFVDASEVQCNQ